MAVFWVVAPCSLLEIYQRFRGPCCVHHQGDDIKFIALMMEAARSSETLVNFYQTTQCYNPEDSHLQNGSLVDAISHYKQTPSIAIGSMYHSAI
jgi:hypothetical protein